MDYLSRKAFVHMQRPGRQEHPRHTAQDLQGAHLCREMIIDYIAIVYFMQCVSRLIYTVDQ